MLTATAKNGGCPRRSRWITLAIACVDGTRRTVRFSIVLAVIIGGLFAARAQATPAIDYPDFSGATGVQLNGSASIVGSSLQLTPALQSQGGTAFSRTEIQPSGSFETEFELRMHDSNTVEGFTFADGMAFVLQPVSAGEVGEVGGDLGYAGISPSAVVQFDIYQNGYDAAGVPDISFMENGNAEQHVAESGVLPFELYGETPVRAWIVYDAEKTELSVYAAPAPASKPASPLFSYNVNLAELLHSEYVFAGFTAGTGLRRRRPGSPQLAARKLAAHEHRQPADGDEHRTGIGSRLRRHGGDDQGHRLRGAGNSDDRQPGHRGGSGLRNRNQGHHGRQRRRLAGSGRHRRGR